MNKATTIPVAIPKLSGLAHCMVQKPGSALTAMVKKKNKK
jgi:hypothetical protein